MVHLSADSLSKRVALVFARLGISFVVFIITMVATITLANSTEYESIGFGWYSTAFALALVLSLASYQVAGFLLSSRQRVLALLAIRNLNRRKRNSALVIVGLLVGSAIISSSLVVGDSLDATLEAEYAEALDETDIVITGDEAYWNQTRAAVLLDEMMDDPDIDATSFGIEKSIGLKSVEMRTVEPRATWVAMDSESQNRGSWNPLGGNDGIRYSEIEQGKVLINDKLASRLEVGGGDTLEVSWTKFSDSGSFGRKTANLTVQAVISGKSTGHLQGGSDPVIFSTLSYAQEVLGLEGEVNRLTISATGGIFDARDAEERVLPRLNSSLNESILGIDIGLETASIPEDRSLGIQRMTGDALLYEGELLTLMENISSQAPGAMLSEVLMAPVLRISSGGENITGLLTTEVNYIDSGEVADWYATPAGLSVQHRETSTWYQWVPDLDDTVVSSTHVVAPGAALSLHAEVIRLSALDKDVDSHDITLPEGEGRLHSLVVSDDRGIALRVASGGAEILFGNSYSDGAIVWDSSPLPTESLGVELEEGELALQDSLLSIRLESAFDSWTCSIDPWISNWEFNSCNWNADSAAIRSIATSGGISWDVYGQDMIRTDSRDLPTPISAHELGLPEGNLVSVNPTTVVVEGHGVHVWNGTGFEPPSLIPSSMSDGRSVWVGEDRLISTTAVGVMVTDNQGSVGRLPYQISLDGFSNMPLIALAMSGGSGMPTPDKGEVFLTQWSADGIGIQPTANLSVLGYMPALRGELEPMVLNYTFAVPALPSAPGQPGLDDMSLLVVNLSDAEELVNQDEMVRSMILVSMFGSNLTEFEEMEALVIAWADANAGFSELGFQVIPMKSQVRDARADDGATFSALFLIFGSFVIFAGILLVMNLFVMLADERKSEMGMIRALGMQRGDLRSMFVMEGTFVGIVSSAVGSIAGIGVARVLMYALDQIVRTTFDGQFFFAWEWHSIISGFSMGFLVTFGTLYATSLYISRMNVVAAMRDIPTRVKGSLPWWTILLSLFFLGLGALFAVLAFVVGDAQTGSAYAWWISGGFLALIGLVPPIYAILVHVLPESFNFLDKRVSRTSFVPRCVSSMLGISMVFWGAWTDPVRADWELGDTSFIVLGVFLVGAGVLLLTSLAPIIARSLARAGGAISTRLASVLPTALAYPLAVPFRTAMTMGMFSLVVFAVVVLSGYSAMFGNFLGDIGEDARGEWEIVVYGSNIDMPEEQTDWDLGTLSTNDFDAIAVFETAAVIVEPANGIDLENRTSITSIRGVDENFTNHGGLPLDSWEGSLGSNSQEVWESILSNDTLVVIDYQMAVEKWVGDRGIVYPGMGLNIGDAIVVKDPFNSRVNETFYVAAVLEEESGWFASGITMGKEIPSERFDASPSSIWFSMPGNPELTEQDAVAKELQYELVEEGANVFAIEVVFKEIQSFIFAMFGLLQAYLALGLAVGIAGLGVITIRNVAERQHQTGILRALGFQRNMVVGGYLAELTWVSLLGIVNGAAVGIAFHYQLYVKYLEEQGAEFILPWGQISLIVVGAYLCTLAATAWPVRKAASIHPAEALRDAE